MYNWKVAVMAQLSAHHCMQPWDNGISLDLNLEQVANPLCALANSASYHQPEMNNSLPSKP